MKKIIVVGDALLDEYVEVESERCSQEDAYVPILDVVRRTEVPGGAANVAVNIASLGDVEVSLCSVTYNDLDLRKYGVIEGGIVGSELVKTRYVDADGKLITRVDSAKRFDDEDIDYFESMFLKTRACLQNYDAIVISDYDKGLVTEEVARACIDSGKLTIVDSKRADLSIFRGADILKVNENEFAKNVSGEFETLTKYVVVTLGPRGAKLLTTQKQSDNRYRIDEEHFATDRVPVAYTVGVGDTHTAALAVALVEDFNDVRKAVKFATACATIAATKQGTSVVERWEYLSR